MADSSWQWLTLKELFEGFHGRAVWDTNRSDWIESAYPRTFYRVGEALNIRYFSDKRDPGDPHGEGAQGVAKLFTHPFGGGVKLFDPLGAVELEGNVPMNVAWPSAVAKLGHVSELAYVQGDSTTPSVETWAPGRMQLWVWSDKRTLMMVDPKTLNIGLIRGGNMRVEPRGIVR